MRMLPRALLALCLLASQASAQTGQLPPGTVWGNSGAARSLAAPAALTAMFDRALGSTQGGLLTRNATTWIVLGPGTAGLPLVSGGAGANLAYAILGLSGGGCNAALTASNGGLLYSTATACAILAGTATAGQIPRSGSSAAPSWSTATYPATAAAGTVLAAGSLNTIAGTSTPVLGVPTSQIGTLGFAGNTSGTATITPQAAAGTPTLTLPNTSGTFAVGGSSPVTVNATTGAVGITGLAGGVLAGSAPAFTTTPVLGASGTLGTLGFGNATSGTVTLQPVAGALGSAVLTMPAATDTIALLAAVQALTNKTYNGNTFTAGTGTLTIAAAKTLTASNTLTLAGTDSTTMTFPSTNGTVAALNIADQTLAGGANVTTLGLSTGNITVDCGSRPLQSITNGGAFTITAPVADGSCLLLMTNNGSAGTVTWSGFTVGSNTGDTLTTTNTSKFILHILRVASTSTYSIKALQ